MNTNFNYNDKMAFIFFNHLKGNELLDMINISYDKNYKYTTFTCEGKDTSVRCVHDTVDDAVISFKKDGKYKTMYIIKGDNRHIFNEYKIRYYDATIKFERGEFIEEVRRKGTLVDGSGDIVFSHDIEDVLIPKRNYAGKNYVMEIVNPNGVCIFKILVCGRHPIEKEN